MANTEVAKAPVLLIGHLMDSRTIPLVVNAVPHPLSLRYPGCSAQMLKYRYYVDELSIVGENRIINVCSIIKIYLIES